MKIEFDLPEGVRLCSFSYENTDQPLRFKSCLAGQPIMSEDGILRPHAIEVGWGTTPQEAIDTTLTKLRAREAVIAQAKTMSVALKPSPTLDIQLDLSFL